MEDQQRTDQQNNGKGPISSGMAPGPGEHLVDPNAQPHLAAGGIVGNGNAIGTGSTGNTSGNTAGYPSRTGQSSLNAGAGGQNPNQWEWPRSETMTAGQDYDSRQQGSWSMGGANRVLRSRGTFLASTVVAGFLLQRVLQASSRQRSGLRDNTGRSYTSGSASGSDYGTPASLEAERKYGLETAYAPETSYQTGASGGSTVNTQGVISRLSDRVRQASDSARTRLQSASESARTRLQSTTADTKARLSDVSNQTRSQYYRAKERVDTMKEERPLLIGALGIAAGAGLGAMIAVTRRERELMGDMRDKVLGMAKETASSKFQTVKESAQRFVDFTKQEAERTKEELAAGADQGATQVETRGSTQSDSQPALTKEKPGSKKPGSDRPGLR